MTSLAENTGPLTSRRSMLCGLAVAMVVPGGLAACSTTTSNPSTATTGAGSTSTDSGTAGSSTASSSSAGAAGLAALADVPDGGGLIVESGGKPLVLTRTGAVVKAFGASCPHAGITVQPPKSGIITCAAHGSQFSATDGSLKKGPATKGLTEVPVKVDGDQVLIA